MITQITSLTIVRNGSAVGATNKNKNKLFQTGINITLTHHLYSLEETILAASSVGSDRIPSQSHAKSRHTSVKSSASFVFENSQASTVLSKCYLLITELNIKVKFSVIDCILRSVARYKFGYMQPRHLKLVSLQLNCSVASLPFSNPFAIHVQRTSVAL